MPSSNRMYLQPTPKPPRYDAVSEEHLLRHLSELYSYVSYLRDIMESNMRTIERWANNQQD